MNNGSDLIGDDIYTGAGLVNANLSITQGTPDPILVDVRGKGLLIGLEYPTPEIGWAVSKGLFKRGVMTGGTLNNAKVNRIEPPGVISYETIDEIITRLDETLTEVAREFSLNSGHSAAK